MKRAEHADKLRTFLLLEVLRTQTDEDHYLTTEQLRRILREQYGIEAHRITIKTDVEFLQSVGIRITIEHSCQNRYRYQHRLFSVDELKMLLDAVQASNMIPSSRTEGLAGKLTALASPYKAPELHRNLISRNPAPLDSSRLLPIVDAVNEAINKGKKICYQMQEHSLNREPMLRRGGEWYTFSPYALVWDGNRYYAVGYSDKHQAITTPRLDRMAGIPDVLAADAVPAPEGFDTRSYLDTMFSMYSVPPCTLKLSCENSVLDAVLDKFGSSASITKQDESHFSASVFTTPSTSFYNWIFGFLGKVQITAPLQAIQEYQGMLEQNLSLVRSSPQLQASASMQPESLHR